MRAPSGVFSPLSVISGQSVSAPASPEPTDVRDSLRCNVSSEDLTRLMRKVPSISSQGTDENDSMNSSLRRSSVGSQDELIARVRKASNSNEEESPFYFWLNCVAFGAGMGSLLNGTVQYLEDLEKYKQKNQKMRHHSHRGYHANFAVNTASALLSLNVVGLPSKFLSLGIGPAMAIASAYQQHGRVDCALRDGMMALEPTGLIGLIAPHLPSVASDNAINELFRDHKTEYKELETTRQLLLEKAQALKEEVTKATTSPQEKIRALDDLIQVGLDAESDLALLSQMCTDSLKNVQEVTEGQMGRQRAFAQQVIDSHNSMLASIASLQERVSTYKHQGIVDHPTHQHMVRKMRFFDRHYLSPHGKQEDTSLSP